MSRSRLKRCIGYLIFLLRSSTCRTPTSGACESSQCPCSLQSPFPFTLVLLETSACHQGQSNSRGITQRRISCCVDIPCVVSLESSLMASLLISALVTRTERLHRPPRRARTKCNVAPPSRLYSAAVLSSFLSQSGISLRICRGQRATKK
jgi:hypothetical protein